MTMGKEEPAPWDGGAAHLGWLVVPVPVVVVLMTPKSPGGAVLWEVVGPTPWLMMGLIL